MTKRKDWIDQETPGRKPGSYNQWSTNRLCLRCRTPYWSTRFDSVACSVKCRMWLSRHPEVLDAAYSLASMHFGPSRSASRLSGGELLRAEYENAGTKRYVVGQWLHYLMSRDEVDMAFELVARTAYPDDKSRWKTLGEDRRRKGIA